MMMMMNTKAEVGYEKTTTIVWWDINSCPIPDGYDAGRVGPSIEAALKEIGYGGPVTITVFGNLEDIPQDTLRRLSSTGMAAKHGLNASSMFFNLMCEWQKYNPAPASMMIISDKLQDLSFTLCRRQQWRIGYNLLVAYTTSLSNFESYLRISAKWLWNSLLGAPDEKQKTRTNSVLQKCSGSYGKQKTQIDSMGETAPFSCTSCSFIAARVEYFTKHLTCKEHTQHEAMINKSKLPDPEFDNYIDSQEDNEEESGQENKPRKIVKKRICRKTIMKRRCARELAPKNVKRVTKSSGACKKERI